MLPMNVRPFLDGLLASLYGCVALSGKAELRNDIQSVFWGPELHVRAVQRVSLGNVS